MQNTFIPTLRRFRQSTKSARQDVSLRQPLHDSNFHLVSLRLASLIEKVPMSENVVLKEFDDLADKVRSARDALSSVIFGQEAVLNLTLATLISGGHGLLVGAPGVAKTLLVTSIADVLGLSAKRVQFTPDLMPADILGSEVLEESPSGERVFRFISGPIFCQLLMADEINRASPRTQSALLQAMQEHFVTVAGARHDLPAPFHVLATQNPIEQEGTYPLPEAQLDRFLMQIDVPFPGLEAERQMLAETTGGQSVALSPALTAEDLQRTQALVRAMPIAERVVDSILALVRSARPGEGFWYCWWHRGNSCLARTGC